MKDTNITRRGERNEPDDIVKQAQAALGQRKYEKLVKEILRSHGFERELPIRRQFGPIMNTFLNSSYKKFELDAPSALTPEYLHNNLSPYLLSISALQQIFNEMDYGPYEPDESEEPDGPDEPGYPIQFLLGDTSGEIVVRLITSQSPIQVGLDGAAEVLKAIKEDFVPWRRKNAQKVATLKEMELAAEIKKKEAEAKEIHARSAKDKAEAKRLEAEASKMHAEAERQVLENEKLRFEIDQAKLTLALELVIKMHPELSEADRILYAVKMLPALSTLVTSEIEFKRTKMLE